MIGLFLDTTGTDVDIDGHPQEGSDGVLQGEDGVTLKGIVDVLLGLVALDPTGFAFSVSRELDLLKRDSPGDSSAENHTEERNHRFGPPLLPLALSELRAACPCPCEALTAR